MMTVFIVSLAVFVLGIVWIIYEVARRFNITTSDTLLAVRVQYTVLVGGLLGALGLLIVGAADEWGFLFGQLHGFSAYTMAALAVVVVAECARIAMSKHRWENPANITAETSKPVPLDGAPTQPMERA